MLAGRIVALGLLAPLVLGACNQDDKSSQAQDSTQDAAATQGAAAGTPFDAARLTVETNATDGDAGLQLFVDHEPWRSVAVYRPDGSKIVDVTASGVLNDYGLTEFFSESSEPPFEKFPLAEFQKRFPAGRYRVTGTTIEGEQLESTVTLSHDFPKGPKVLTPGQDATVPAANFAVTWEPVTEPAGITIVGYQVVVTREEPLRVLSAGLPAGATRFPVPPEFLAEGGEYKVEVAAIDKSGNQTFTEVTFKLS